MHAFKLRTMGVNLEKLLALSTVCIWKSALCLFLKQIYVSGSRDMCSPIFLDNVVYWHFDLMVFVHCPQERDCLLCSLPHLYVRGRTFFSLWGLCFIFSCVKNLLLLWVNFSLVLGILLVMLRFRESSQESKLLRLLSDRNSVSPRPWQLHLNS